MTTVNTLKTWFNEGKKRGCTHMIVAVDTFDHTDYPIFCKDDEECLREYDNHNDKNMQRVMEVYDLRADMTDQMDKGRVLNLPETKD